ncbi:TadE/TadG family type IV pilus assembly protein [Streptomyces sp. NPDC102360]|uniref:TadE/TadG family type IV pilus assembly protein n=1 Tax=Streptomyces sp. NPDC102360 TaxID=3366160 RepID=UPI00380BF2C3
MRRRSCWSDAGGASVEMTLILPLVFTLILLLAQAALYMHAIHIAQAAAAHALAVSRVENGTVGAGGAEGDRVLDELGRGPLQDIRLSLSRGDGRAEARVTGTATAVLPFLRLPVRADAVGPVEAVTQGQGDVR